MDRLKHFIEKNPVRVAAWVSATVAIVMTAVSPDMPVEPVVTFVLASLGLGEFAQRKEDQKTAVALATVPTGDDGSL